METQYAERIILTGPTGSGKTTVGAAVAGRLGWEFVDTDALVVEMAGASIPEIFAREGEGRFRELETAALRRALDGTRVVVATGAGSVERPENVALMRRLGWVVGLTCAPETALARIQAAADGEVGVARPMLDVADPLVRMRELAARRAPWYSEHDSSVSNDNGSVEDAASLIIAGLAALGVLPPESATEAERSIGSAGGGYTSVVAWGGLATLGERLASMGFRGRASLIIDDTVARLYERPLVTQIEHAGLAVSVYRVPAGEASKSREQLAAIHDWLAEHRAERSEPVIALGGGMVGDLAGFAAATYLRGVPLVQIPTSLLAQVDASIGGKTGINLPAGKNLVGAFYPPRLVLADPAVLLTLPPRQLREGWAEVVKHGVALDATYFDMLERNVERLAQMRPRELTEAVAGSVAIKASVVEGDELEGEGGRRHLLNYGHTLGHAIEAVTGYGAWLHGEAVTAGMAFAARLGVRARVTPAAVVERQEALLARFGLPLRIDGLPADALLRAMLWDKKVRGGQVRWVLPNAVGASKLVADVSEADVHDVLLELGAVEGGVPQAREDRVEG